MKFKNTYLLLLLLAPLSLLAQDNALTPAKMETHRNFLAAAKTTIADPAENYYDITYLKFDLNMSNASTYVQGGVSTTAKVLVASMSQYVFELDAAYTIDSIRVNGNLATATTSGFVRTVNLSPALAQNAVFTATVYYHGQTQAGTGFFTHGVVAAQAGANQIMYTLSDRFLAKDWWPCKQSLIDKIDSVDMWVTVPQDQKAGCNGLLKQVKNVVGGYSRYEWKTNYPIEYYLISVNVAPYRDYSYYMHFTPGPDSMLVQNYIYDSLGFMQANKPKVDSIGLVIDYFSQIFGRYPFWKEKYGHCLSNLGGGMENQTMSTVGVIQTYLLAHELSHQWWGDYVTYKTWRDIWLSEGWASYAEQLFAEHYWGVAAAFTYRQNVFNSVMSAPDGSVYVDDTTSDHRVFDSRLTYDKGAAVAHMLRFVSPNDNTYFIALRAYLQQYAFNVATTDDFKVKMASGLGVNLDTFFNQWVYGQGYPTYKATWKQKQGAITIELQQTASSPANTPLFYTPLELTMHGPNGDTTIKIYNNSADQWITFNWAKQMDTLYIDPNNWILNKVSQNKHDQDLGIAIANLQPLHVYPNPTNNQWTVEGIVSPVTLRLYDVTGKVVWHADVSAGLVKIPAASLASGVYMLKVESKDKVYEHTRLTKL